MGRFFDSLAKALREEWLVFFFATLRLGEKTKITPGENLSNTFAARINWFFSFLAVNSFFYQEKTITMEFIKDLWLFMRERKKYWLAPVIMLLLFIGILLVFGGSSSLAPFIYSIF